MVEYEDFFCNFTRSKIEWRDGRVVEGARLESV